MHWRIDSVEDVVGSMQEQTPRDSAHRATQAYDEQLHELVCDVAELRAECAEHKGDTSALMTAVEERIVRCA